MFSNKKSKKQDSLNPTTSENRINEGTTFIGDIQSNGFIRIDGTVEGDISSPARVVIGKTGVIKGTLHCDNADIEGKVHGALKVAETLSLRASAVIHGDVKTTELIVEPRAELNGNCNMQSNVKTLEQENGKSKAKQQKKKKIS